MANCCDGDGSQTVRRCTGCDEIGDVGVGRLDGEAAGDEYDWHRVDYVDVGWRGAIVGAVVDGNDAIASFVIDCVGFSGRVVLFPCGIERISVFQ